MAKAKLYDNQNPACAYCRYGICRGQVVLCEYKGVVDKAFKCRKFKYDPIKRIPIPPVPLPEYDMEDFRIN